jgi:hypothetical protein
MRRTMLAILRGLMRAVAISGERKKQSPMLPWTTSFASTPVASSPRSRTKAWPRWRSCASAWSSCSTPFCVWLTAAGTSMSLITARASHCATAALPAVRCKWSTRSTVGDEAGPAVIRAGSVAASVPSLA